MGGSALNVISGSNGVVVSLGAELAAVGRDVAFLLTVECLDAAALGRSALVRAFAAVMGMAGADVVVAVVSKRGGGAAENGACGQGCCEKGAAEFHGLSP